MDRKYVLFVVMLVGVAVRSSEAVDAMKFLAVGFIKVLDECKKELNLDDHLIVDLYNYWKLEFALLHRDTGCAIICMSKKLELLDESGSLHHGNAKEFAKKNGATDDLAGRMVTIIRECEANTEDIADACSMVLEVAKCFRVGIHELKWEPSADVIITEVLTEI